MAYQIKVTLRGITPPVWRRLRVPGSITFEQLHRVIQASFGWLNYHLYRFDFEGIVLMDEDPDDTAAELWKDKTKHLDPNQTLISSLFEEYDECLYEYDLGDSWKHDIVVEKRLKENKRNSVPVCLAGARHRPPEDVGGVDGYEDFLASIRDKNNPEREEKLRWAEKDTGGRLFDPEYFYLDEVNRKLEHVLKDTPEFAQRLLAEEDGLTGTLRIGWFGPVIEVRGEAFTWDRLGDLVSMLDDNQPIAIKVGKQSRRKH